MEPFRCFDKSTTKEREKERRLLLHSIPLLILEILEENKAKDVKTNDNIFMAQYPPSVKITDYLERLAKYTKLENSTLIIMLIYLDRIADEFSNELTYKNIHRLVFSAVIAAIKYNEDDYYSNEFYAKVGGIKLNEANDLEEAFCVGMEFAFFVSIELFERYKSYLEKYIDIE